MLQLLLTAPVPRAPINGDVEANKAQKEKLDFVFDAVKRLEASDIAVLESVNKVLLIHIGLKYDFESLSKRVTELEFKLESFVSLQLPTNNDEKISKIQGQIVGLQSKIQSAGTSKAATNQNNISKIQDKIDDLENPSRRSNVLFYCTTDGDQTESWETVKKL